MYVSGLDLFYLLTLTAPLQNIHITGACGVRCSFNVFTRCAYLSRIQYMLHGCSGQLISDVLYVDCLNVILVEYSTCYMGVVIS